MKNNVIFITTIILFIWTTNGLAQQSAIGFRVGATYFTLDNEEINEDAKYTLGLNLAIPFEYGISSHFSIQPEFHFTQKGVQLEDMVDGQEITTAVKTNYLELPILFKVKNGNEKFGYYIFAAPSVGYATKRFLTEKVGDGDKVKTEVDFIEEGDAQSQRWEFSALAGIGGSMNVGIGSIVLDARYSFGLTDNTKFKVDKPADWTKTTNRGCTISVGYMIPIGG